MRTLQFHLSYSYNCDLFIISLHRYFQFVCTVGIPFVLHSQCCHERIYFSVVSKFVGRPNSRRGDYNSYMCVRCAARSRERFRERENRIAFIVIYLLKLIFFFISSTRYNPNIVWQFGRNTTPNAV